MRHQCWSCKSSVSLPETLCHLSSASFWLPSSAEKTRSCPRIRRQISRGRVLRTTASERRLNAMSPLRPSELSGAEIMMPWAVTQPFCSKTVAPSFSSVKGQDHRLSFDVAPGRNLIYELGKAWPQTKLCKNILDCKKKTHLLFRVPPLDSWLVNVWSNVLFEVSLAPTC